MFVTSGLRFQLDREGTCADAFDALDGVAARNRASLIAALRSRPSNTSAQGPSRLSGPPQRAPAGEVRQSAVRADAASGARSGVGRRSTSGIRRRMSVRGTSCGTNRSGPMCVRMKSCCRERAVQARWRSMSGLQAGSHRAPGDSLNRERTEARFRGPAPLSPTRRSPHGHPEPPVDVFPKGNESQGRRICQHKCLPHQGIARTIRGPTALASQSGQRFQISIARPNLGLVGPWSGTDVPASRTYSQWSGVSRAPHCSLN